VREGDGGIKGEVLVADGQLRLRQPEARTAKVTVIIPTAGKKGILQGQWKPFVLNCLRSLGQGTLRPHEIIVVDNGNLATDVERQLVARGVRRLSLLQPFNFAANLNQAARRAAGDYLLFLNDDVEVITPDWLETLLDFALQPGVGAVGAKLFFPDGRLQHVGVLVPDAEPCHPYYGCQGEFEGYDQSVLWPRSFLAVTGACLLTPRALFLEMGGFDEAFSLNYNDVDYCLRLWERDYRSVYVPYAELVHYEAMGRGGASSVRPWELALFKKRWAAKLPRDPFDNLTPRRGTASTS
jgi:GT2 family glycosyltransferase